jgi:hypothetical protein
LWIEADEPIADNHWHADRVSLFGGTKAPGHEYFALGERVSLIAHWATQFPFAWDRAQPGKSASASQDENDPNKSPMPLGTEVANSLKEGYRERRAIEPEADASELNCQDHGRVICSFSV